MTNRTLPKIEALQAPDDADDLFVVPESAEQAWTNVKAASSDDSRTLNIYGRIGESIDGRGVTLGYVTGALRRMGKGPVTVNIASPGGDFFTGLPIYNALREHDGEVIVKVIGVAASAGSLIAMASDKLLIAKAGFLMIHNASVALFGTRHVVAQVLETVTMIDEAMAGVYAARSGQPERQVAKWMDKETMFKGEDAVKHGFADGLLQSDEVVSDSGPKAYSALDEIDASLRRDGKSKGRRRRLMQEAGKSGTSSAAADDATSSAGETAILAALRGRNFSFT